MKFSTSIGRNFLVTDFISRIFALIFKRPMQMLKTLALFEVVENENNDICLVLTRDQWNLVTTRDPKKLQL